MEIKIGGRYRHFKGNEYEVLCVAKSSEDPEQELVIYQSLDKEHIWARPKAMFLETVERDGKTMQRFEYLGE